MSWRGVAVRSLAATVLFIAVAIYRPFGFDVALRLYGVALAAIAMAAVVSLLLGRFQRYAPAPLFHRRPRPAGDERPADLVEVEAALEAATWNRAEVDRRLRPIVSEVERHRSHRQGAGAVLAGRTPLAPSSGQTALLATDSTAIHRADVARLPGLTLQELAVLIERLESL
jgi:hypothetical protein